VANLLDGLEVVIKRTDTPEKFFRELQKRGSEKGVGGVERWEDGSHLDFNRIISFDEREPERDGPYEVIIRINLNEERRSVADLISNPPIRQVGSATVLEVLALLLKISEMDSLAKIDALKPFVGSAILCPGSILSDNAVVGFARKNLLMRAYWMAMTCVAPYFDIKLWRKL